jgi:hypothetical protein
MNASEFNVELQKVCQRGLEEGVAINEMGFETMLGVLEMNKAGLMDWHRELVARRRLQALQAAAAGGSAAPIVLPGDPRFVRGPHWGIT